MSQQKPNLNKIFALNAPSNNIANPDDTSPGKFEGGWVAEIPPFEWFNYIQNLFSTALAHINQNGLCTWDNQTEYNVGSLVKGSDGVIYQSTAVQSNNDPVGDASGSWVNFVTSNAPTVQDATESQKGIARFSTTAEAAAGTNTDTTITPKNLKDYVDNKTSKVLYNESTDYNIGDFISFYDTFDLNEVIFGAYCLKANGPSTINGTHRPSALGDRRSEYWLNSGQTRLAENEIGKEPGDPSLILTWDYYDAKLFDEFVILLTYERNAASSPGAFIDKHITFKPYFYSGQIEVVIFEGYVSASGDTVNGKLFPILITADRVLPNDRSITFKFPDRQLDGNNVAIVNMTIKELYGIKY